MHVHKYIVMHTAITQVQHAVASAYLYIHMLYYTFTCPHTRTQNFINLCSPKPRNEHQSHCTPAPKWLPDPGPSWGVPAWPAQAGSPRPGRPGAACPAGPAETQLLRGWAPVWPGRSGPAWPASPRWLLGAGRHKTFDCESFRFDNVHHKCDDFETRIFKM